MGQLPLRFAAVAFVLFTVAVQHAGVFHATAGTNAVAGNTARRATTSSPVLFLPLVAPALFVAGAQAAIGIQMSRTPARADKRLGTILTMASAPRIRRSLTLGLAMRRAMRSMDAIAECIHVPMLTATIALPG
jgi:hypothetical protein